MSQGAVTASIDIAQITLYLFWFFFAGLVIYLRKEDKREGYPLEEDDASPLTLKEGWPGIPAPKTFVLSHGGTRTVPAEWVPGNRTPANAIVTAPWRGAPLEPTGNPLLAGVGPGAWAERSDVPDMTLDGRTKIVPIRTDASYSIDAHDPDPRGRDVLGADGVVGGKITDLWVDRSEHMFRYLEVEVAGKRRVLLPINFTKVLGDGTVTVRAILGSQFADVPGLKHPEQITLLEEDKVSAYYGAGTLYAEPGRAEPFL
jgi:photosynthetic reaction center H subunit